MKLLILLFFIVFQSHAAITHPQANTVIDQLLKLQQEEVSLRGPEIRLEIIKSKKMSASSKWKKRNKIGLIQLSEQILQAASTDEVVLALILCHEMGHFLGGEPFVRVNQPAINTVSFRNPYPNMSVEGQADFYSTNVCIKKYARENALAEDILYASFIKTISLYRDILHEQTNTNLLLPSIDTPSNYVTNRTLDAVHEYPSLQCRLDTLISGLQQIEGSEDRPLCWFLPPL